MEVWPTCSSPRQTCLSLTYQLSLVPFHHGICSRFINSPGIFQGERTVVCCMCLRRCRSNVSWFSPSVHCCSSPIFTCFLDSGTHVSEHMDNLLSTVVTWDWKGILVGTDMFYFSGSFKFPQGQAPCGNPFHRFSFFSFLSLWSDCWPLFTSQIKTQT